MNIDKISFKTLIECLSKDSTIPQFQNIVLQNNRAYATNGQVLFACPAHSVDEQVSLDLKTAKAYLKDSRYSLSVFIPDSEFKPSDIQINYEGTLGGDYPIVLPNVSSKKVVFALLKRTMPNFLLKISTQGLHLQHYYQQYALDDASILEIESTKYDKSLSILFSTELYLKASKINFNTFKFTNTLGKHLLEDGQGCQFLILPIKKLR